MLLEENNITQHIMHSVIDGDEESSFFYQSCSTLSSFVPSAEEVHFEKSINFKVPQINPIDDFQLDIHALQISDLKPRQ